MGFGQLVWYNGKSENFETQHSIKYNLLHCTCEYISKDRVQKRLITCSSLSHNHGRANESIIVEAPKQADEDQSENSVIHLRPLLKVEDHNEEKTNTLFFNSFFINFLRVIDISSFVAHSSSSLLLITSIFIRKIFNWLYQVTSDLILGVFVVVVFVVVVESSKIIVLFVLFEY